MNKIFTSLLLLVSIASFGQTADSAITMGGVEDVFYDFETQDKTSISRATWDIAITMDPRSSSVLINENGGVELFLFNSDTTDWDNVDTTGLTWTNIYNSEASWDQGAFSNQGTAHPDYGWGIYNMNTHDIIGNRIFIIKTKEGDFKQIMVSSMKTNGVYTFRIGDIGGANSQYFTASKLSTTGGKSNLLSVIDLQDVTVSPPVVDPTEWDLQFTKYITYVEAGPNSRYQPVGGVKVNAGCQVAQRDGMSTSNDDTTSLTWNTDITEIGWDWKTFNLGTSSYSMVQDRTYFVRTQNGAIYKLWFTDYTVGTSNVFFNTKEIKKGKTSIETDRKLNTSVYPNPAKDVLNISNKENDALTVTLMNAQGAAVYTGEVAAFTNASISSNGFAKGVYFLQLSTSSTSNTQRVIFE